MLATESRSKIVSHFFLWENDGVVFSGLFLKSEAITFMKIVWIFSCLKVIMMNGYFAIQRITSFFAHSPSLEYEKDNAFLCVI